MVLIFRNVHFCTVRSKLPKNRKKKKKEGKKLPIFAQNWNLNPNYGGRISGIGQSARPYTQLAHITLGSFKNYVITKTPLDPPPPTHLSSSTVIDFSWPTPPPLTASLFIIDFSWPPSPPLMASLFMNHHCLFSQDLFIQNLYIIINLW